MKPKTTEQARARKLRSKGFSIKEIAEKLKISKGSVSIWVRNITLDHTQKQRLSKREKLGGIKGREKSLEFWRDYRITHPKPIKEPRWPDRSVETFFDTWTPNMAYVLGYFAADGHMFQNKNGSSYIAFTSTDKELIISVKEILKVLNKIEIKNNFTKNWKTCYVLQIGSKKIYDKFLKFGFTPNKSLTLTFPDIPDNVLADFIRGYFDGDGCATFECRKRKDRNNKIYSNLMMRFTSGSHNFLKTIQTKLKFGLGIQGSLHPHGTTTYDLAYSSQDVIKLYSFLYPNAEVPSLKRKQVILSRGLQEKYNKGS